MREEEFLFGERVTSLPEGSLKTDYTPGKDEENPVGEAAVKVRSSRWVMSRLEKIGTGISLLGLFAVAEPLGVGLYGREFYDNADHFNTVGDRVAEALEIPVIKKKNVMNEARSYETLLGYVAAVAGWSVIRASSKKRAGMKMGNSDFEK